MREIVNGKDVPLIGGRVGREDYKFASLSLAELRELWAEEMAPREGECCCPVFEDGSRGFRQRCEVHGKRTREDFARLTVLRCEIVSRLRGVVPESGIIGGKGKSS